MNKSILEVMHEIAKDFHKNGAIDDVTMREIEALCLPQVKIFTPNQIKRLSKKSKSSQTVFVAFLNTSKSTVQKWEQGLKKPNGPSLKLLNLVAEKGIEVLV